MKPVRASTVQLGKLKVYEAIPPGKQSRVPLTTTTDHLDDVPALPDHAWPHQDPGLLSESFFSRILDANQEN